MIALAFHVRIVRLRADGLNSLAVADGDQVAAKTVIDFVGPPDFKPTHVETVH